MLPPLGLARPTLCAAARGQNTAPDTILRFLVDLSVPFTNNLAEQALRIFSDTSTRSVAFGCYLAQLWLFPRSTLLSSHPHKALSGLAFSFLTTRGVNASKPGRHGVEEEAHSQRQSRV